MSQIKVLKYLTVLLSTSLLLVSCECVPDVATPKEITPEQYANVMFINANPYFDHLKFRVEGNAKNINAFYFNNDFNYYDIIPGKINFRILTSTDSMIFNSMMSLKKAVPYTLFAFGSSNRILTQLLEDTISNYTPNNSYFRCINLVPEKIYMMFLLKGSYEIPNIRPYRTHTRFDPTYSGTYDIQIINTENDSLLITHRRVIFEPGLAYTLLLRGNLNETGKQKINLEIISHDFWLRKSKILVY